MSTDLTTEQQMLLFSDNLQNEISLAKSVLY